jgi:hypothetical protein
MMEASGKLMALRFAPRLDIVEDLLEIDGEWRIEIDAAPIARVRERESRRVEEGAIEPHDRPEIARDPPVYAAIHRITHDWMADTAQVYPDLMGATGRDRHLQQ